MERRRRQLHRLPELRHRAQRRQRPLDLHLPQRRQGLRQHHPVLLPQRLELPGHDGRLGADDGPGGRGRVALRRRPRHRDAGRRLPAALRAAGRTRRRPGRDAGGLEAPARRRRPSPCRVPRAGTAAGAARPARAAPGGRAHRARHRPGRDRRRGGAAPLAARHRLSGGPLRPRPGWRRSTPGRAGSPPSGLCRVAGRRRGRPPDRAVGARGRPLRVAVHDRPRRGGRRRRSRTESATATEGDPS